MQRPHEVLRSPGISTGHALSDQRNCLRSNGGQDATTVAIQQGLARNLDGRARASEKRGREIGRCIRSAVVRIFGRTLGRGLQFRGGYGRNRRQGLTEYSADTPQS